MSESKNPLETANPPVLFTDEVALRAKEMILHEGEAALAGLGHEFGAGDSHVIVFAEPLTHNETSFFMNRHPEYEPGDWGRLELLALTNFGLRVLQLDYSNPNDGYRKCKGPFVDPETFTWHCKCQKLSIRPIRLCLV